MGVDERPPQEGLTKEQKLQRIRQRLIEDFEFYAKSSLKIRTKDGKTLPLILNRGQKRTLAIMLDQIQRTGKVRIIILKGRQMGLSTFIEGFLYWWTTKHKGFRSIVVTHHSDATTALFDMTKRYHDNVPDILRPSTKYSSRKEIVFDKLDSSFMVATAGSVSIGRGQTLQGAHLSELAFWDAGGAVGNLSGLIDAIPNVEGTIVCIESTANGMSGPYYEYWNKAVEGSIDYLPVFIPWYWDESYRVTPSVHFERTKEEQELVDLYELDDAQLCFRRLKVSEKGLDLFKQEYPCCPEEAFITTGRPVFDLGKLQELLKKAPDILERMTMEQTKKGDIIEKNPAGELLVYYPKDPGDTYYIGADVAMGLKKGLGRKQDGDYSVAQVLDGKKRLVATFRAHVAPDYFARILAALGTYYNFAKIAVEANNHGLLTVHNLYHTLEYSNVFLEQLEDTTDEVETVKLGFKTTMKSKPMIIDLLRAAIRDSEILITDKTTLKEMISFIVTESGKLQAEEGCHDDCVMALAIANYIHEGVWAPIKNNEDWYFQAL